MDEHKDCKNCKEWQAHQQKGEGYTYGPPELILKNLQIFEKEHCRGCRNQKENQEEKES